MNKLFSLYKYVLCAALMLSHAAYAQEHQWSVSPYLGMHKPDLKDLNDKALKAPIVGVGTFRGEPDSPQADLSFTVPLGFENELDPIGWNANAGLEFQWRQSDKNYFIMGASTWEGYTRGRTSGSLPIQGSLYDVVYDRRIRLSYNEFYLGLRHIFVNVPNRYRFYGRLSFNEIFDVDFREEHIFSIDDEGGDLDDVKRIFISKGQITGIGAIQFGGGGEYFLNKSLSISGEFSYLRTEGDFQFTNATSQTDTQLGDDFDLELPISRVDRTEQNSPLGYIPPDTDATTDWTKERFPAYSAMNVSFDGWKAAVFITLYY